MAVTDTYKVLTNQDKIDLFTELLALKEQKSAIDKRIKVLESGYKEQVKVSEDDLFFELPNKSKFSIKKSFRKGVIDTELIKKETGIDVENYRKAQTAIHTLRLDK